MLLHFDVWWQSFVRLSKVKTPIYRHVIIKPKQFRSIIMVRERLRGLRIEFSPLQLFLEQRSGGGGSYHQYVTL